MKVEKKAVRSGILKLEKNVQITLDEDMNVPDTRPDVEKIIESRGEAVSYTHLTLPTTPYV